MKTPSSCYCMPKGLSNWRVKAVLLAILVFPSQLWAVDFLAEGERQLSLNNPAKAVTYLEAAAAQGPADERLLLDLGLTYARLGQNDDAVRTFRQGADLKGAQEKVFHLNLGILSYRQKDWAGAEAAYSDALSVDPNYGQALLNRANTRLNTQNWAGAEADYKAYQVAAPDNPQKEKIDQVIALLDRAITDQQAAQLAEETKKKQAEAAAVEAAAQAKAKQEAAEAAAAEEKKRQDEILAKVRESLATASGDSQSLSTGPSDVKSNSGDFSLDSEQ